MAQTAATELRTIATMAPADKRLLEDVLEGGLRGLYS